LKTGQIRAPLFFYFEALEKDEPVESLDDDDDEDEEDEDEDEEEEEEEEEETRNFGFEWILRSFFWTLGLTSDAWTLPPNLVFNIFVFWIFLDRLFDEKMPKLSSISKSRRSMISSFSVRKISADFLTKLAGGSSNQKHCRGIGS